VHAPRCGLPPPGNLAALYAQSRPAMLSRRCLTATAGTSLVRDSKGRRSVCSSPGWRVLTPPGAETLDRALAQWLRFLTAADGGVSSDPGWLADRPAQLGIVGCAALLIPHERTPRRPCLLARAAGTVGQRLVPYSPLGRAQPRPGPGPDLHVSGAQRAFAPNHSQIYPPTGLASQPTPWAPLLGWDRRLRLVPARPGGVRPRARPASADRPWRL